MKTTKIPEINEKKSLSMRKLSFVYLGASLCTVAALAQGSTDRINPSEETVRTAGSSPVAYVYVSTPAGINLYDAASNGMLTKVSGSPFHTSGLMIGSNGKYLISLGTNDVRSYQIASNGAIEEQASYIDTQLYAGGKCGTTAGAVLDHTGQDIYVSLKGTMADDGNQLCEALQATSVSTSSGALTFKGDILVDEDEKTTGSDTLPVLLGNNDFAYSVESETDSCETTLNIFARESSGALRFAAGQNVNYPTPPAGGYYYNPLYPSHVPSYEVAPWPSLITDDTTNHLAIALFAMADPPCGPTKAPQLASFTADGNGNLTSTNTWENMPTVPGDINAMRMSPSGNLLAVATGTGVQIFHLNGPDPITEFTGVIGTSGYIGYLQWDKSNHLYAVNEASRTLHVYTVTTTSAVEAPGSPYAIGASANGLVVMSK